MQIEKRAGSARQEKCASTRAWRLNELSASLGIGRRTITRRIASGEIRAVKIGRAVLVPVEEVDRLLGTMQAA